ncbi:MAG: hypothetical protein FWH37_09040 [Candidatus Bathyarchaeota archaeon]|nr:hypothetical protein [Candidatus Termiticorpusculum sp.]
MMDLLTDIANVKAQKAIAMRNTYLSIITIVGTAFLTVLMPLMLTALTNGDLFMLEGLSVLTIMYIGLGGFMITRIAPKYEEYSGDYLMFFSVKYFEKKLETCPDVFKKDVSSIVRIAEEIAEIIDYPIEEEYRIYAELMHYYNLQEETQC